MKSAYSTSWKSSSQPRKQRKGQINASKHTASKNIASNLTKELREKHNTRSCRVRVGDKIKVMRGSHKGETGNVEKIDVARRKVFITKIELIKKDGTKVLVPFNASNLMITELSSEDKKRFKNEDKKNGKETPKTNSNS